MHVVDLVDIAKAVLYGACAVKRIHPSTMLQRRLSALSALCRPMFLVKENTNQICYFFSLNKCPAHRAARSFCSVPHQQLHVRGLIPAQVDSSSVSKSIPNGFDGVTYSVQMECTQEDTVGSGRNRLLVLG